MFLRPRADDEDRSFGYRGAMVQLRDRAIRHLASLAALFSVLLLVRAVRAEDAVIETKALDTPAAQASRTRNKALQDVRMESCVKDETKALPPIARVRRTNEKIATVEELASAFTKESQDAVRALNDNLETKVASVATLSDKDLTLNGQALDSARKKFLDIRAEVLKAATTQREGDLKKAGEELGAKLKERLKTQPEATCDASCMTELVDDCVAGELTRAEPTGAGLLGGFGWQSTLAEGVASFLSQRAADELTLWFTENFQRKICVDSASLLPETCKLLGPADDITYFPPGGLLVAAIRSDLEALPVQVLVVAGRLDASTATLLRALFDAIRRGDSPVGLLAGLPSAPTTQNTCSSADPPKNQMSLPCALARAGALVQLAGDVATRERDAGLDRAIDRFIEDLKKHRATLCNGDSAWLCSIPATNADAAVIKKWEDGVRKLGRAIAALQSKVNAGIQGKLTGTRAQYAGEILSSTIAVVDAGIDLVGDGNAKNKWKEIRPGVEGLADALHGNLADSARKLVVYVPADMDEDGKFRKRLAVLVDLASAKTSDDVRGALSNAAAPVGSWRVKRTQPVTFSVTAIIGGAGGYEAPINANGRAGGGAAGAMAAVGIDVAAPTGNGWTFGGFVSLIDVGQLLSTQFDPKETDVPAQNGATAKAEATSGAEFRLTQVLSPGGYLRFGVGNTPFTFGLGVSVAPELRKYTESGPVTSGEDPLFTMIRGNVFLGIDSTLIPF